MVSFIESSSVKVFPTAFRTESSSGKYTNEENFVGIINSVIDNVHSDPYEDGFIVSVNGTKLSVVIHGYLFTVNDYTNFAKSGNLWLAIRVEDGVNNSGALVDYNTGSITLDSGGNFTALIGLTGTSPDIVQPPAGSHRYYLKVLEGGDICTRNFMKFKSSSINYSGFQSISDKFKTLDEKNSNQDDEINAKQPMLKFKSGGYIEANDDKNNNISLNSDAIRALNSITKQQGDERTPIYITANGEAKKITNTIGKISYGGRKFTTDDIVKGAYVSQNIFMPNGVVTPGYSVWASTNAPNNAYGENGDFWFKYE